VSKQQANDKHPATPRQRRVIDASVTSRKEAAAETDYVELVARARFDGRRWRRVQLDGSPMPVLH